MTTEQPKHSRRVVTRIARYSRLRSAERALLPSVRRRGEYPSIRLGRVLISKLHELLDAETKREFSAEGGGVSVLGAGSPRDDAAKPSAMAALESDLDAIDSGLGRIALEILALAARTPLAQLRATLPSTTRERSLETVALLDLHLEALTPDAVPPFLVDYMITLLARSTAPGVRTLRADPCAVSPGVKALCSEAELRCDERSFEFALSFRAASFELLDLDDLEPLILRVRETKSRLGACFFDREVLRCLVNYNIAVSSRLHDLLENERSQDSQVEHTLAALRALDDRLEFEARGSPAS